MRVINLCHGEGNGVDTACLMTASNMLIGRAEDGDENSCVCPVIRSFIIRTNDAMPPTLLAELYGPLAWEILGTRTEDIDVIVRRAKACADFAAATSAATYAATYATSAATYAAATSAATYAATYATYAATYAASAATYAAAYAAASAAYAATYATYAATYATAVKAERKIWESCRDLILELCEIGDTRPKEPKCVMTEEELAGALA